MSRSGRALSGETPVRGPIQVSVFAIGKFLPPKEHQRLRMRPRPGNCDRLEEQVLSNRKIRRGDTVLEARGIAKRFPGVVANDHIDFDIRAGEIHAILGENGAGKTTLMKILFGLLQPDGGEIYVQGEKVTFRSPLDAIQLGIGMVHQNRKLIPAHSVLENIILGHPGAGSIPDMKRTGDEIIELCTDTASKSISRPRSGSFRRGEAGRRDPEDPVSRRQDPDPG